MGGAQASQSLPSSIPCPHARYTYIDYGRGTGQSITAFINSMSTCTVHVHRLWVGHRPVNHCLHQCQVHMHSTGTQTWSYGLHSLTGVTVKCTGEVTYVSSSNGGDRYIHCLQGGKAGQLFALHFDIHFTVHAGCIQACCLPSLV